MSKELIFSLQSLINATDGNPDSIVDAIWEAGYRRPERSAEEAAQLIIDAFFECNMFGIPAEFWPDNWSSVLQGELMKTAVGEEIDLNTRRIAERIIAAGYVQVVTGD